MKTFRNMPRAALVLTLCSALAGLAAPMVARAADMPPPVMAASPGALYQLGPFERRGVQILAGGTLEIRVDGCWRTDMTVVNTNPAPRTVSISFRWYGRGSRVIAAIHPVRGRPLAPGVQTAISESGCSAAIARNYPVLGATSVVRVMSVR